jgi:hypothetical protein
VFCVLLASGQNRANFYSRLPARLPGRRLRVPDLGYFVVDDLDEKHGVLLL